MTSKDEVRRLSLRKRRSMSERERKDNSLLICENLIMMPQIEQANTVMLYAPMQDEADVWLAIDGLLERGKCVVLPYVRNGQMQVAEYCADDILTSDRHGILEPDPQYTQPAEQIDVAIVPRQERVNVIRPERFSVRGRIAQLRKMLRAHDVLTFSSLFVADTTKDEIIATFLALLEIVNAGEVRLVQRSVFEEIEIIRKD